MEETFHSALGCNLLLLFDAIFNDCKHKHFLLIFLLKWLIKSKKIMAKIATFFMPFQYLFGVEKGNGHIYIHCKGHGFQNICVVSPLI